jgi:RimJ/RimL family protein N-acetyltransferase
VSARRVAARSPTRLREVESPDLEVFFEQQLDAEATWMAAFPARDREAFHAHWQRILRDATVVARTVVVDGAVAGNVVSFVHEGVREVGYWLGKPFWGRGIATVALREFLAVDAVRPLYAAAAEHNVGSIRVLEKCGFVRCGEEDGMVRFELAASSSIERR